MFVPPQSFLTYQPTYLPVYVGLIEPRMIVHGDTSGRDRADCRSPDVYLVRCIGQEGSTGATWSHRGPDRVANDLASSMSFGRNLDIALNLEIQENTFCSSGGIVSELLNVTPLARCSTFVSVFCFDERRVSVV